MFLRIQTILCLTCAFISLALLVNAQVNDSGSSRFITGKDQDVSQDTSPPWGPDDFRVLAIHRTTRIRRDATFTSAIGLLSQQAQSDFNGRLPRSFIAFRNPKIIPRLSIIVSAVKPDQRVLRRHVFWGIAQILNQMIRDDAFTASNWRLESRGQEVGTIFFIAGTPNELEADSTIGDPAQLPSQAFDGNARSLVIVNDVSIVMGFEFIEPRLTMEKVFMGAIAAVIDLAEKPNRQFFDTFAANYPGYACFYHWRSTVQPSAMTKELLISVFVLSLEYALQQINWHSMRVGVKLDGPSGRLIVVGGYSDSPNPADIEPVSSS
ncbi:MAG: hypothetical protein Q9169_004585 [Polycauliona sp. 2 TL-2023]